MTSRAAQVYRCADYISGHSHVMMRAPCQRTGLQPHYISNHQPTMSSEYETIKASSLIPLERIIVTLLKWLNGSIGIA